MANNPISNQVYLSRDLIREQIIEYTKSFLELENVDLTKSSFLTYLINTLSTLTSNILFYQLSTHKEFFLTEAQLAENILNLSAYIGYTPSDASYSTTEVLMTIPFGFEDANTSFEINEGFKFSSADGIIFSTYYHVQLNVTNNTTADVVLTLDKDLSTEKAYNLPVVYDTEDGSFSFSLPVRQYVVNTQEFQIDSDTPQLQFVTLDVPIDGKVSELTVEVRSPGAADFEVDWEEFNSLFLMSAVDKGYVSRRTDDGRRLYFGNDLIGVQPQPGSTIRVNILETVGADGDVIPGSITTGDRLYSTTIAGANRIINYNVINASPASGGSDEESLEEIRRNAIANLVSLNRLVSTQDFKNTSSIIPDSPLAANSLPILKRSDLKTNEIALFTTVLFDGNEDGVNEVVPTKNAKFVTTIDSPNAIKIDRGTIINIDSIDYITLFDIYPDLINEAAYYEYILDEIQQIPSLVTKNSAIDYDIILRNLVVKRVGTDAVFELLYESPEPNVDETWVEMEVVSSGITYNMTNNAIDSQYELTIPYTQLPKDTAKYDFTIYQDSTSDIVLAKYSSEILFIQKLDDFMLSNGSVDGTNLTIYDIPVVQKEYYDSINQRDFEQLILQKMLNTMDFSSYKMTTDFVNLKFANTTGKMISMQYNSITRKDVIRRDLTTVPLASDPEAAVGSRYIINGTESGEWENRENQMVEVGSNDTTSVSWLYSEPVADDTVYISAENGGTKVIYTEYGWRVPIYDIPLQIELHVFKEPSYLGTLVELADLVKNTLVDAFSDRFGSNVAIYRSEIIKVIQDIEAVHHCRLVKPESNIFFNFDIEKFDQTTLLEYGPEYVYFDTSSISVKVL